MFLLRSMEQTRQQRSMQRVVTLALQVLDQAAYLSRTEAVDTTEVRLALAALWCVLEDRRALLFYYERACAPSRHPWDTCREPYYHVAKALRNEGWDAPVK